VAIPAGTRAKMVVSNVTSGGRVHSPELVLDLYSVDIHGEQYRVDSSSVTESNKSGLGLNRRTAEYTGGGAGFGALMGAVFGGGKGAGIGALAGAGGGALTQLFTRGKQISVPAETAMTFRLERTLVMHP
jgi:outer membrane lipoprotein SlyB